TNRRRGDTRAPAGRLAPPPGTKDRLRLPTSPCPARLARAGAAGHVPNRRYALRVKVVGVTCSTKSALFSLVENGEVVDTPVERVEVGSLHEASEELEATLAETGRTFAQLKPDLVVLLMPEQSRF